VREGLTSWITYILFRNSETFLKNKWKHKSSNPATFGNLKREKDRIS